MAKWKLIRQIYGSEEFTLSEGEKITVGRGNHNNISLSSAVISRNHCVLNIQSNLALITDLKSSNGVYIGKMKIPSNVPYTIEDSSVIGLGWTVDTALSDINDSEKFIFKLVKDKRCSLTNRIKYPSDNEIDNIEAQVALLNGELKAPYLPADIRKDQHSPVFGTKLSLKRKADSIEVKKEKIDLKNNNIVDIVDISDSDNEIYKKPSGIVPKKTKFEPLCEESLKHLKDNHVKSENALLEYEAFNVKQEYLGYDDEPIQIDSDSDSESEQWLLRLSQTSPGKPFTKIMTKTKLEMKQEESSYSQLDDFICNDFIDNEEEYMDDIITIPEEPPKHIGHIDHDSIMSTIQGKQVKITSTLQNDQDNIMSTEPEKQDGIMQTVQQKQDKINFCMLQDKLPINNEQVDETGEFSDDIISISKPLTPKKFMNELQHANEDVVDGLSSETVLKQAEKLLQLPSELSKKVQIIDALAQLPRGKSSHVVESKVKSSSKKHSRVEKKTSKKHISSSLKEERKKKLKEIAIKDKDSEHKPSKDSANCSVKSISNVKVTASNRGAFLTDVAQVIKPKDSANISKEKCVESSPKQKVKNTKEALDNVENNKTHTKKSGKEKHKGSKHRDHKKTEIKSHPKSNKSMEKREARVPLKSVKLLTVSEESLSGKPVSKVGPLPPKKPDRKVRFSETPPQVIEFEIEPGNRMKKTSLVKTSLLDVRQTPVFSLEKITLMKILRWNPQWLEEQMNNNDPPPILGHNNIPMTIFHSFVNHNQYVQLIGDLLLMEIWECLTIPYMKIRSQSYGLQMRIESLPPVPSNDRCFELFNFSVNVSLPSSEAKNVARMGEILLVTFGPDNAKNQRFFYVNNVRTLPSPSSNKNNFYSISLQATFTEKMKLLRPGELIVGRSLAYINKELMLFEAMEYLAGSPLSDAILKPEPYRFVRSELNSQFDLKSQWTATLNPSQLTAVNASVSAALGDKPSIQMVQGPPGTGKSSVICAIVMTYFYNAHGKKQQNRGKILICATSNAAVDGLVIRLLNLRQSLPKPERFRMVRVGRAEAMHAVASNVSSQQLAARDMARLLAPDQPPAPVGFDEEILHLEAKINMWKTAAQNAQDPVRVAYCQGRVTDLCKRINLLRSSAGRCGSGAGVSDAARAGQLAQAERRIIAGADIVVTTLASAQNHKMRGLKRRIALCIIDEAGQAIEPETLIPLTLDVTKLTLIGDPQQLPGFICSQRAKKHGLGESLFSRLSSCSEHWPGGSPVALLSRQYRMHADIADYPSRAFYDGRIQTVAPVRPDLPVPPYTILSISSGDKGQGLSGANEMEAWGVSRLVTALETMIRPLNLNLAVITPYSAHKELIKKYLRMLHSGSSRGGGGEVEVNTVDSFQGQERDVVVVSLARSQGLGFLADAGRMNVMLTRARHALLVCLNPHALLKNNQWRTLIEDAQRRNFYRVLPNKVCQPVTSAQVLGDDILKYLGDCTPSSLHQR